MASVTWKATSSSSAPYLVLTVSQGSQSISGNYTNVSYSLKLYRPYNINSTANKNYSIKINGSTVKSGSTTIGGSGTKTIASGSTKVYHNSDGTKKNMAFSFTMDFSITWSGVPSGDASGSGTMDLTTIPRASSISSFPNFTIGNDFTVKISRASSSFTHTLRLYVGSTLVAERTGIGTQTTFKLSTAEQNKIYQAIPSKTSTSVTMRCQTYSGSTAIGSYVTKTATASVSSSIKPTFTTVTHSEYVASVKNAIGSYVQSKSRLSLAITGATGAKYSTIKSYKITFDGSSWSSRTATSEYIKGSGSLKIVGTVTDSRGRTASKTVTVTVLAYAPPKITSFTAIRCDSGGNADTEGEYIKVYRAGTWNDLGGKNPATITIKTKPRTSSSYVTKNTTNDSASGFAGEFILSPYSIIQSFDVRIEVKDLFNTTISTKALPTGQVTMSWGRTGIGVGKIHEGLATLEVGGNISMTGTITPRFDPQRIPVNSDLNDYQTPGMFYCPANVDVATMSNVPSGNAFSLLVQKNAGVVQTLITYPANTFVIYIRSFYNGTWGSWRNFWHSGNFGGVKYGTGSPPSASGLPDGTLYVQY